MAFSLRKVEPHEMGSGPVTPTLLRMAVPSVVAGLLATSYQLVDTLFVSWLGEPEVRGVAMGMPVLFVVYAIGQAAAIGLATLLSRRLGEGDPEGARRVLNQALLASLLVGGMISLFSPGFSRAILTALGTPEGSLGHGVAYMSRILFAVVLFHVGMTSEAGLRAQGNTMTGMWVSLVANALNLVLDGFLIFGPENPAAGMPELGGTGTWLRTVYETYGLDGGVAGGATATIIARCLGAGLLVAALLSRRSQVRPFIPWAGWPRLHGGSLLELYKLGLPATVSILGMSASAAALNAILVGLDASGVPAFFIAHRLEMFAFVPMFALGGAVVPLVSYNVGLGDVRRCRHVIVASCLVAGGTMGAIGVLFFAAPRALLGIFGPPPDVLDMGTTYLRINSVTYFIIGCDIMLSSGLQGLGRADLSMVAQLLRAVVVRIPIAYLLGLVAGITGVWFAAPVSTIACFIFAAFTTTFLLRRLRNRGPDSPAP